MNILLQTVSQLKVSNAIMTSRYPKVDAVSSTDGGSVLSTIRKTWYLLRIDESHGQLLCQSFDQYCDSG